MATIRNDIDYLRFRPNKSGFTAQAASGSNPGQAHDDGGGSDPVDEGAGTNTKGSTNTEPGRTPSKAGAGGGGLDLASLFSGIGSLGGIFGNSGPTFDKAARKREEKNREQSMKMLSDANIFNSAAWMFPGLFPYDSGTYQKGMQKRGYGVDPNGLTYSSGMTDKKRGNGHGHGYGPNNPKPGAAPPDDAPRVEGGKGKGDGKGIHDSTASMTLPSTIFAAAPLDRGKGPRPPGHGGGHEGNGGGPRNPNQVGGWGKPFPAPPGRKRSGYHPPSGGGGTPGGGGNGGGQGNGGKNKPGGGKPFPAPPDREPMGNTPGTTPQNPGDSGNPSAPFTPQNQYPGGLVTNWLQHYLQNPGEIDAAGYVRAGEQANAGYNLATAGVSRSFAGRGVDPSSGAGQGMQLNAALNAGHQRNEAARDYTLASEEMKRKDIQQQTENYMNMLQQIFGLASQRANAAGGKNVPGTQFFPADNRAAEGSVLTGQLLAEYFKNRKPATTTTGA